MITLLIILAAIVLTVIWFCLSGIIAEHYTIKHAHTYIFVGGIIGWLIVLIIDSTRNK